MTQPAPKTSDEIPEICEVVITAPDAEWLTALCNQLVAERLCAAAHLDPIRTIYRWDNKIHDERECRATLHTRVDRVAEIIRRTNSEHPYVVPCVVTRTIAEADTDYRQWIIDNSSIPE